MALGIKYILCAVLGFFLGGVLFSYHIPKLLINIDTREMSEDGNPGTFNAFKYAGVPIGVACLVCDLSKGFLPVWFACTHFGTESVLLGLVIAAPVLGHACAPFYRGHGGKAIAAAFGCLLGLVPYSMVVALLIVLYVFFSVVVVINPHEKRSFVTFGLLAIVVAVACIFTGKWNISAGCTAISAIVMYKNREREVAHE